MLPDRCSVPARMLPDRWSVGLFVGGGGAGAAALARCEQRARSELLARPIMSTVAPNFVRRGGGLNSELSSPVTDDLLTTRSTPSSGIGWHGAAQGGPPEVSNTAFLHGHVAGHATCN